MHRETVKHPAPGLVPPFAGKHRRRPGVHSVGHSDEVFERSIIHLTVASVEIRGLVYAASVGHLHIDTVGVVAGPAQQALAAGNGDIGNDGIATTVAIQAWQGGSY